MNGDTDEQQRVDRWLWHVRFFRSRSLATAAVAAGHVHVNGSRVKPGHRLRTGDLVEVVRDRLPFRLEVVTLPGGRGSATAARSCYRESDEAVARRAALADAIKLDRLRMPRTPGRPDKRTRRQIRDRNRGVGRD